MRFLKGILLALLISLTTWLGGCDDEDQDVEEPPVVRETAGEEVAGGSAGEEAAGEDLPLDQGVSDAGEMAGDQDVSGEETSVEEDCSSEDSDAEEGCVEPEAESSDEDLPQS